MPPEIQAFLVEFARSVQRLGLYPSGHPVAAEMSASTYERLLAALTGREALNIHVDRRTLTIEGVETDPEHILFRGLAQRLYRHLLFEVTFNRGIGPIELGTFLSTLAIVPGAAAEPLGSTGSALSGRWPNILLEAIPFEALALAEEGSEESDAHWSGEAAAQEALQEARSRLAGLDLPRLSEVLREAERDDQAALHDGIARLVLEMEPGTMRELMLSLPESYRKNAAETAVERSIQELIEAADEGRAGFATEALLQLLVKLALLTEEEGASPDPEADAMLVALLQRMGTGWDIENPNPSDYQQALRSYQQTASDLKADIEWDERPDSERIVQISLELDETAPPTLKATADLISGGRTGALLDILDDAPTGAVTAQDLWQRVDRKDTVGCLLRHRPVDYRTLDRMINRIWVESAGPMLDSLLESESRLERLTLLDCLSRIGPEIGPLILERLDDPHWYRIRNLLSLLGQLPTLPEGFSPEPYLDHTDARVRREAFQIALTQRIGGAGIVIRALGDPDSLVVEKGLLAARRNASPEIVNLLIGLVSDPGRSVRLRILGLRALGSVRSPAAFATLRELVWERRWPFRRTLAAKSALMLEALATIARNWHREPGAQPLLAAARRSSDPQIRAVARGPEMVA
jgi:hypothetical protein